jgi:integrase
MGVKVREKPKGSGMFWVFVSHKGKRASKKVGIDEDTAYEVAKKIEAKLVLGEFDFKKEKPVPTFKEYAKGFINGFSKINHKPSTHESYKGALDVHIYPVFGKKRLDEIRKKDIKAFLTDKQKEKLSPATVRNLKAYLSCILNQAVDDEIIESNPASRTGKLIKKTDSTKNIYPFTWEEKELFEKTLRKHFERHYPLFLTALRTGLRVGEVIALKPGDIDFNGNFIEVRRSCVMGKVATTKSGKVQRVDMSNGLRKVLKSYLTERKQEALKKGWGQPPEWLFYNGNGNLFDTSHLRKRIFYKVLEKAGLRRTRIHDLRHTYATLRINAGHNIADVSRQLGHHSIKITVDTYYHWIPGTSKSEVDQLDGNGIEDKKTDNASKAV